MKKYLKFIFTFLLVFVFFENVNAETLYNYSCDYSFNAPGSGEEIKFRIRMYEISDEVIKNTEIIGVNDKKYWKEHVKNMYLTKNEKDGTVEFVISDSPFIENFYNKNSNGCSTLTLFDDSVGKELFIRRSVSNKNIVCPQLYVSKACVVTFYDTLTDFDTFSGAVISEEKTTPVKNNSMNCYKNASDKKPTTCTNTTQNGGSLYDENQKECEYYANNRSTKFKLVYDKNNKTLRFDDMNNGFTLDSSVSQENKSGSVYITDQTLLSTFESSNSCPYDISCDCSTAFMTGKGKTCSFNVNDNKNCGVLVSNNGEKTDGTGKDPNGTSPNLPDGWDIDPTVKDCASILGPNLTKLVHFGVNTLKIVAAIIAIVNGMISFVPAIMSKDQDALKKAGKKCIYMAVVLALIFILPYIARLLGNIFDFDITCLV